MNMKKINFYEYLPQRFAATSEQIVKVRNLIYNFKSGRKEAANFAADLIVRLMWNWYGHKCNEYTIVCVPASSAACCFFIAALLQEAGAEVMGALFIAKSVKGISKKSYNQYK